MTRLVIDTFAGPGGWDTGLRMAGYTGDLVGIEHDPDACATAVAAGHTRIQADVATFDYTPYVGRTVGFIGSPPCQAWSLAGLQGGQLDQAQVFALIDDFAAGRVPPVREWVDERSALTAEPMRAIVELSPRWVALEQVPAVLPLWRHVAMRLRERGYRTWHGILSAEEYGVPQTRKRAILVASLDDPVGPPAPTHQAYTAGKALQDEPDLFGDPLPPPVSMAEALGWTGDVALRNGAQDNATERGMDEPAGTVYSSRTTNLSWVLRNGNQANACTRGVDEPAGTMYFGQRGNAVDWVLRTGNNTMVTGRTGSRAGDGDVQRYERPVDLPAPTLDTNVGGKWTITRPATTVCGDARIGAPGHRDREGGERQFESPDTVRVSVQEAGILQSFPPDYPWQGTKTAQYRQVGDAVPPLLARATLAPFVAASSSERAA